MIYVGMNLFVMMEYKKKIKITVLGHFAECCTRQRTRCRVSWSQHSAKLENGRSENRFFSFAECHDHGTRQRIFLKKIQTLPSAGQGALGKEFFLKK